MHQLKVSDLKLCAKFKENRKKLGKSSLESATSGIYRKNIYYAKLLLVQRVTVKLNMKY